MDSLTPAASEILTQGLAPFFIRRQLNANLMIKLIAVLAVISRVLFSYITSNQFISIHMRRDTAGAATNI